MLFLQKGIRNYKTVLLGLPLFEFILEMCRIILFWVAKTTASSPDIKGNLDRLFNFRSRMPLLNYLILREKYIYEVPEGIKYSQP